MASFFYSDDLLPSLTKMRDRAPIIIREDLLLGGLTDNFENEIGVSSNLHGFSHHVKGVEVFA